MTRRWRQGTATAAAAGLLAVAAGLAGCGARPATSAARQVLPAAPPALATSFTGATGTTWAIVDMGGPSAQNENFWQLFVRRGGAAAWRQATPAGVADNGGLVVAGAGGAALVTGFRPSQDLTYSPLAATGDNGGTWSASGLVSPGLANVPDALAAGAGGRLAALTQGGQAELGTRLGATWTALTSAAALARTPAGRACGLSRLTAVGFSSSGGPLLAGDCGRDGVAGVFAQRGGGWQAAGPALPASLAGQRIAILRLAAAGPRIVVLLQAGTGPAASVVAAWSSDGGGHWALSAPLPLGGGRVQPGDGGVRSASLGADGAAGLLLTGGRGETIAAGDSSWQALPALPRWTAAVAVGPSGMVDALTADGAAFADWRLGPGSAGAGGSAGWHLVQTLHISIPYGSSG